MTSPCRHSVEIRRPLASEIDRLLLLPDVRDRLTAWGAEPVERHPERMDHLPTAEPARRSEAVRLAGIEPE